jgi:hypothetical protein
LPASIPGIDWTFWRPVLAVWAILGAVAVGLVRRWRRWWQCLLIVGICGLLGYLWFAAWVGARVIGVLLNRLLGG